MSAPPRFFATKLALHAICMSLFAPGILSAQNFTLRSGNLDPFGVNGPLPFGEALELVGLGGIGIKGGFGYGLGVQSTYDSNFAQTPTNAESEFITGISPSISYFSDPEGGASVRLSANYQPTADFYLENPELNGVDHTGSVLMTISGARTTISAFAGYIQESATDRFAGGFVTGSALSMGLRGSYQLAPRTSIFAGLSTSISDFDEGFAEGFSGYRANVGGFWTASERFRFGPSLSYSTSKSSNTGTRDTWNLSMVASYQMEERIKLAGSFGLEYSEDSRSLDSGELSFSGSLSASYRINELWTWRLAIQSGFVPSPTQTNYVINSWTITSLLNRELDIGAAALGVDLEISDDEQVGAAGPSDGTEEYMGIYLTYGRPVFNDRMDFSSSVRYSVNNGRNDWTQIQVSAGLSMSF